LRRVAIALFTCLLCAPLAASARQATGPNVVVAGKEPKGSFELVGHDPLMNRGMNAALAVHDGFVYVGSRTDGLHPNAGIMVVDARDPQAPVVVNQITSPAAANPGETTREMRIWPQADLLMVLNLASNCSYLIHACSPTSAVGDDVYRFFDISDPADPKLVSEYVPSKNPHEFYLWVDPKDPKRALLFQSAPSAGSTFFVTDISGAAKGKFKEIAEFQAVVPNPETDNRFHSLTITPDGKRAHVAALGAGYLEVDVSEVTAGKKNPKMRLITNMEKRPSWGDPGAHSAVPFFGRDYVFMTDEVYGYVPGLLADHGCPWGWVRIIDLRDHIAPKVVSEFKLEQNTQDFCDEPTNNDPLRNSTSSYASHNPTLTRNLAVLSWHAGGLQAIDISDPANPVHAAEFVPEPLPAVTQEDPVLSSGRDKVVMWSFPVIADGLIYVTDVRNGLYIVRYEGPFENEINSIDFLEGNSNLGDALKLD
jgi:hypothetical protein